MMMVLDNNKDDNGVIFTLAFGFKTSTVFLSLVSSEPIEIALRLIVIVYYWLYESI